MTDIFDTLDLSRSIRDYDFTRKAIRGIHKTVESDEFVDMDATAITRYLIKELDPVSFRDQLKRYLFERAGLKGNYSQISDDTYIQIISCSIF